MLNRSAFFAHERVFLTVNRSTQLVALPLQYGNGTGDGGAFGVTLYHGKPNPVSAAA